MIKLWPHFLVLGKLGCRAQTLGRRPRIGHARQLQQQKRQKQLDGVVLGPVDVHRGLRHNSDTTDTLGSLWQPVLDPYLAIQTDSFTDSSLLVVFWPHTVGIDYVLVELRAFSSSFAQLHFFLFNFAPFISATARFLMSFTLYLHSQSHVVSKK
jgi:hypothetical protein